MIVKIPVAAKVFDSDGLMIVNNRVIKKDEYDRAVDEFNKRCKEEKVYLRSPVYAMNLAGRPLNNEVGKIIRFDKESSEITVSTGKGYPMYFVYNDNKLLLSSGDMMADMQIYIDHTTEYIEGKEVAYIKSINFLLFINSKANYKGASINNIKKALKGENKDGNIGK